MKVIELFSGIGGMHYALEAAGIEAEIMAVEINPIANAVYSHNFPSSTLIQKNILSLKVEEINKFAPDVLLMSPPCQPFTRVGLKKDLEDTRTDPLKHILLLLPEVLSLTYVLVENVKGFEISEAREKLTTCLQDLNFSIQEFLISPSQFGVPNMRTRYYLLAKKQPLQFDFRDSAIIQELPEKIKAVLSLFESKFSSTETVADVLETDDVTSDTFQDHLLSSKLLEKRAKVMDIVTKHSCKTCCFTKAYGHYAEGTGSVYCPYDEEIVEKVFAGHTQASLDQEALRALHLRYFTSREIARLMSFPENFTFPAETTKKQKYRLLGNSVNVKVVALLIRLMLYEPHR